MPCIQTYVLASGRQSTETSLRRILCAIHRSIICHCYNIRTSNLSATKIIIILTLRMRGRFYNERRCYAPDTRDHQLSFPFLIGLSFFWHLYANYIFKRTKFMRRCVHAILCLISLNAACLV